MRTLKHRSPNPSLPSWMTIGSARSKIQFGPACWRSFAPRQPGGPPENGGSNGRRDQPMKALFLGCAGLVLAGCQLQQVTSRTGASQAGSAVVTSVSGQALLLQTN